MQKLTLCVLIVIMFMLNRLVISMVEQCFYKICPGGPHFKSHQSICNKISYCYQFQVNITEQSQITQDCGYLVITVILQLGVTL